MADEITPTATGASLERRLATILCADIAGYSNILCRKISMDTIQGMGSGQSLGHLTTDLDRRVHRESSVFRDHLTRGFARERFVDRINETFAVASKIADVKDVRVVDLRCCFRVCEKPFHVICISGKAGPKEPNRDRLVHQDVPSIIKIYQLAAPKKFAEPVFFSNYGSRKCTCHQNLERRKPFRVADIVFGNAEARP